MSDACYCDYDPPEVYEAKIVRARKDHRCGKCGCAITAGDQYEYVFGIWEGEPDTHKTCGHCLALRKWVTAHVPCVCWGHGNMIEDLGDTVEHYAHEAPGLQFGFMRRVFHKEARLRLQARVRRRMGAAT